MKTRIKKLIEEINLKKEEIAKEYDLLKDKYWFKIEWRRIIWNKWINEELSKKRKSILDSIFWVTVREIISIPFIWMMLIPALFLDLCLFIYQNTAIRLYKIPLAKRSDYIVFDRKQLSYLNFIQKIDCIYCSYVNWLFQYWVEVAWRTEKYWCPIKHARKKEWEHKWEEFFADYWDVEWFKKCFWNVDEFEKIKK